MKLRCRTRRSGFTIVELIVVVAVVAILVALLLPAVHQARSAARRSSCINNLKQLGLALHNYHDVFGTFPPGWVTHDNKAASDRLWGWQVMILPYVDQAPLFNRINFHKKFPKPSELTQTEIETYRCPEDTADGLNPYRDAHATSNYSGNFGNIALRGSVDPPKKSNGIFYWNSSVRIRSIIDGTSNTFMVGERSISSAAGIWVGLRANQNENDAVTDCSHDSQLNTVVRSFSSPHRGGSHFLFCDGSVQVISEEVESSAGTGEKMGTYQKLGQRNDGQPFDRF